MRPVGPNDNAEPGTRTFVVRPPTALPGDGRRARARLRPTLPLPGSDPVARAPLPLPPPSQKRPPWSAPAPSQPAPRAALAEPPHPIITAPPSTGAPLGYWASAAGRRSHGAAHLWSLRLLSLAALVACAVLVGDHLHPGRAFCPLADACAAAAESPLGTIGGIPTATLGLGAFGAFFLITLFPARRARPVLRPAGILAGVAGAGFIAYQAWVLETFCPLCLVVDGAAIGVGIVALSWGRSFARGPFFDRHRGEAASARVAWVLAAVLATLVPFGWPRSEAPSWEEITPLAELEPELLADEAGPTLVAHAPAATVAGEPSADMDPSDPNPPEATPPAPVPAAPAPLEEEARDVAVAPSAMPPVAPTLEAPPTREPDASAPTPDTGPAASSTQTDPPAVAETPMPAAMTVRPTPPPAPTPAPAPAAARPTGPLIVEYLNPYCPHCRATHRRLEKLLADSEAPIRRRRIYAWGSNDYPLWARACAYAQSVGLEERMFKELLLARSQRASEVYAAAERAGLDARALRHVLRDPTPPARLARDRQLMQRARLRMLPTLDIGRRRLMGEQTEAELRVALDAAADLARAP